MPLKIAVIADTHLSNVPNTAQKAAFDFALKRLQSDKPDIVLFLGDVTAAGTLEPADYVRTRLDESGLCFRMIPGNSDERTPALCAAVAERLTVASLFYSDEHVVCLLDFQGDELSPEGIARLKALVEAQETRRIIIGSHYPLSACMENPYLQALIQAEKISLFIAGHKHRDQNHKIGKMSVHTVRGLDPDKAIGGPPTVTLFEFKDQEWKTEDIPFEEGTVAKWSPSMRQEFIDHLGFSCMSKSLEGLHYASLHDVRCVELRAPKVLSVPREELLSAVKFWRNSGGRYLSMHMPDLSYDTETAEITGIQTFRETVLLALALEVDHMVLHVPRVSVDQMQPTSEMWVNFAETFLELCTEPMERGIVLGVENLHMRTNEACDGSRGFGYLPEECLEWIAYLRKRSDYAHIGIHLDIGHARNNPPFSKKLSVGQWYALLGKEVVGYHLHQVLSMNGMKNHNPITDVYGPIISMSSFFWGWATRGLCRVPMFLEIRSANLEETFDSLQYIRQHVMTSSSRSS